VDERKESMISDLDSLVPSDLLQTAWKCGDEFAYPHPNVLRVVEITNENRIAILGFEFFHILPENQGFATETYTGYELRFNGYWPGFVQDNNLLAAHYIEKNRRDGDYGFILTSTSEREFLQLKQQS
jgi:hypothetical protein